MGDKKLVVTLNVALTAAQLFLTEHLESWGGGEGPFI